MRAVCDSVGGEGLFEGFVLIRGDVTDIVPSFSPSGLGLYNRVSPVVTWLDRLLFRSPVRRYAYHRAMVFRKGVQ